MSINLDKIILSKNETVKFDEDTWITMEYNDILYIISKSLRDYREENNLSQKELAKKIKVSQPMIGKLESGKYNASIKFLVKLWNKLSNKKENFAEKLLTRIYDKVVNNYNYSIEIKYNCEDLKEKYKDVIQDRYKELLKVSMKQEYNIKGVCNFENYEENSLAS